MILDSADTGRQCGASDLRWLPTWSPSSPNPTALSESSSAESESAQKVPERSAASSRQSVTGEPLAAPGQVPEAWTNRGHGRSASLATHAAVSGQASAAARAASSRLANRRRTSAASSPSAACPRRELRSRASVARLSAGRSASRSSPPRSSPSARRRLADRPAAASAALRASYSAGVRGRW